MGIKSPIMPLLNLMFELDAQNIIIYGENKWWCLG